MITVLAVMAMSASPAAAAPRNNLVALQGMYQQSCQVKAYGSYDDICNGLKKQLKEAEKQAKRDRNQAKAAAAAEAKPAEPPAAAAAEPAPKS
jgi:hypothetical protein